MSNTKRLIKLIKKGKVDKLRAYLDECPDVLNVPLKGFGSNGYALHCAAYFNKPEVITFLVKEKGQNLNQQEGVGRGWTPLHEAKERYSLVAVARLLELGADPSVTNNEGFDTVEFCKRDYVQSLLSYEYFERKEQQQRDKRQAQERLERNQREERERVEREQREEQERLERNRKEWKEQKKKEAAERNVREQEKILERLAQERKEEIERKEREEKQSVDRKEREENEAIEKREADIKGTWVKTTSQEVVHDYKQPEQKLRFIDTFNFEARCLTVVVENLKTNGIGVNKFYFDNIPDKTALKQAFDKLKDLGGNADEASVKSMRSIGKKGLKK